MKAVVAFLVLLVSLAGLSQVEGQSLDLLGGICNLKDFINTKCPGENNTSCVVCVFQGPKP